MSSALDGRCSLNGYYDPPVQSAIQALTTHFASAKESAAKALSIRFGHAARPSVRCQWCSGKFGTGGTLVSPLPLASPPFPYPLLLFPPFPYPSQPSPLPYSSLLSLRSIAP